MAERRPLNPDLDFIRKMKEAGGETFKQCYQCATCSVVCTLSSDDSPFPRKEMIWAQWGLKDKLTADPDVWLCHQCGDCSSHCPRGAKPADALGAIRAQTIEHYATPSALGKLVADKKMVPVLVLIAAVLVGGVISLTGNWMPPGDVMYGHMFSHMALNIFFSGIFLLSLGLGMLGVMRFWKGMNESRGKNVKFKLGTLIGGALGKIVPHSRFKECGENKARATAHLLVVFGFVGLLIVTVYAIVVLLLGDHAHPGEPLAIFTYPLAWFDPGKVLGIFSGIALVVGSGMMVSERMKDNPKLGKGTYFDWFFLGSIVALGITGFLTWILRMANIPAIAYPMYFIHLVVIFLVLIYLPYSKFAHMMFRTAAMTWAAEAGIEPSNKK